MAWETTGALEDGFVYHGHDSGVEGGLTNMAYMPNFGVGYFFSINRGSGDAFEKVAQAIRAYITNKLQKPELPAVAPLPANAGDYAGWYEPDPLASNCRASWNVCWVCVGFASPMRSWFSPRWAEMRRACQRSLRNSVTF
jgi:hypothetical protein